MSQDTNKFLEQLDSCKLRTETKEVIKDYYLRGDYHFVEELLLALLNAMYSIDLDQLYALLPQNQKVITRTL